MSAAATLARGRALAQSLMTSTCVVTRVIGETWDPVTLQNVPALETVYEGQCRVRQASAQDHAENAADQSFVASLYVLSLPVTGSEEVHRDDLVTVTTCPEDAALEGDRFSIFAAPAYSHGTARRIPVRRTE